MPLKAFRNVPKDLVEWGRWFQDQDQAIQDVIDSNRLKGSTVMPSLGEKMVTVSEVSDDYTVFIEPSIEETFWVTSKKTTSFVINSSNATSTATVNWILFR